MYPNRKVVSFCRRTRRVLEIHAEGLTKEAASTLAAVLRKANLDTEALIGFSVEMMPLSRQVELVASNEALKLAA